MPKLRLILLLNSFLGGSDSLGCSELFRSLATRPFAVVQQAVIHVPGQRVACARAVEGHERQRTILPEENLILTLSAHRGSPRSPVLNRGWFPPSLSLFVFSFWCT